MEIGLYTLSDLSSVGVNGQSVDAHTRIKEIAAAAQLAEQAGLDLFGIGEHHRLDFAVSAPAVVLAAIAASTSTIRLTSAVTVLSTADPVRVYEEFATLDLVSGGRVEIIAGRGVFREPFSLFDCQLEDYDALFEEKLALFDQLNQSARVTWKGRFRAPLNDAEIAPRALQPTIPVWIGVGGSPDSVIRAGRLGLPMALAVLGGPYHKAGQLAALYRSAGQRAGLAQSLRLAINGHLHIAESSQAARADFYPYYSQYWVDSTPAKSPGPRIPQEDFNRSITQSSGPFVGSPAEIIDKISLLHELTGMDRFVAQVDIGGMPFNKIAGMIDLLAEKVIPHVRGL
ncbi:Alkanal monooxygenase alpha chain [Paraburkholderia hiiakae]|uniref:Alkanal monooxygenase alpha chain n=1 Tax=Paraburkholderia hiiakae TaxID=1081782 RepID=A0ABM8P1H5_9BURK|nr:LLM class flavin-dependent oxidoreductase [Paraburkholderia hiiakae]CAD6553428.1 Alkanal monooxygenase alpha chain [Paraburkholderia hiiakae]